MHRSLLVGIVPCLALAAVLTSSREAHAGPYLAVDLDLGTAFQNRVDFSYGLGGRIGYKLYFEGAPVWLLPEIGGHFMSFGSGMEQFSHAGSVFGGARFGFDGIVQPNVFAHLGLGFVGQSELGPHADLGVGVDFQLTRVFSLGLQVAYNSVTETFNGDAAKWVSFGVNFGFDLTRVERDRRRGRRY